MGQKLGSFAIMSRKNEIILGTNSAYLKLPTSNFWYYNIVSYSYFQIFQYGWIHNFFVIWIEWAKKILRTCASNTQ